MSVGCMEGKNTKVIRNNIYSVTMIKLKVKQVNKVTKKAT